MRVLRTRVGLVAFAYAALIFVLSSIPHLPPPPKFVLADKVLHAIEFAVLGVLSLRAAFAAWPRVAVGRLARFAALFAIGYGALDEVHQAFVPGRHADPFDALADAIGASLAVAATASLLVRRRDRSRDP